MTVPPVAKAAKRLIIRVFIVSTSETPETAASPFGEIIIVSKSPIEIVRNCSIMSGIKSLIICFLENISVLSSIISFFLTIPIFSPSSL